MDSSTSHQQLDQPAEPSNQQQQQQQPRPELTSRSEIRRAILTIVRRILLNRMIREHRRAVAARATAAAVNSSRSKSAASRTSNPPPPPPPTRLPRETSLRARAQSRTLESILYKRASSHAEYADLNTLERRVRSAGRAVYMTGVRVDVRRREIILLEPQPRRESLTRQRIVTVRNVNSPHVINGGLAPIVWAPW